MGNRFLMARYRPSEALLDQIFMQRWGIYNIRPKFRTLFRAIGRRIRRRLTLEYLMIVLIC